MGISSGWARAPPRQQHASRACHCKTFMQRSRFIAKFAMHTIRAAPPAAPTTMPRACVRNVEGVMPNIRFNVTNCTNQRQVVRRQTWVEHPDAQLHWRHGACGLRPQFGATKGEYCMCPELNCHHCEPPQVYIYTYLYIRRAPLATLCMARAMQRHALGVVTNNRTCNGGRVANTAGLTTWNGGSQSCNWQQARSWRVQHMPCKP